MAVCVPAAETPALELGPLLHSSLCLAPALPAASLEVPGMARADARRPSEGPDQIPGNPPRRIARLVHLDPAQLAAVTAALGLHIAGGASPIPSLVQRRDDASDSDSGSGSDDETGHPNDRHLCYPLIRLLETGDARIFFPGSVRDLPDAPQGGGLHRISDAYGNPYILKAGTETFAGPCELTNETTRTWVIRLKITTKLVCLSKQQLHEQNWELSEECFAEVAGQSLEKLLEVACSFSDANWSDVHISQQLSVFDALVDVLFNIQDLRFSRSGEVAGIINKMVNAFRGVIDGTSNDIRGSKESTIHPATFVLIQVLEFFCRNRDMVQSILESGDYNTGPCSDMFSCLASKLKECAEKVFQQKGQRYIFVLNNMYYVLQKNRHSGLLPPNVAATLVSVIDQYVVSYLDEYWFPPMLLYLEGDSLKKPRRSSLDNFIGEFFRTCNGQMTWKVQTELKNILREEIVNLIVPKYVNFSEVLQANPRRCWSSWLKGMWRTRSEKLECTGADLAKVIGRLFER
ncbi:hypothetical protein ACQJBY_014093 [Aegilops geniculata]